MPNDQRMPCFPAPVVLKEVSATAFAASSLVALVLTTIFCSQSTLAAEHDMTARPQIGTHDPRDGYETPGFETRSRRIDTTRGSRMNLAALAADPPLGLPALPNPPEAPHIDLGRRLFFDRRLSANETLSCGMCHVPEQAFTQNELATPVGIEGRFVRRNAPALYNVAYRPRLFHDGRETSLSAQIFSPLLAANEMGNPDRSAVLARIAAVAEYRTAFAETFTDGLTNENLGAVLAAYQRALLSADSPFDRWYFGGDPSAMSPAAREGFFLFNSAGCSHCHSFNNQHAHFTDDTMHRTGVEFASRARESTPIETLQIAPGISVPLAVHIPAPNRNDNGRLEVTGKARDEFRYRTPTLRNVSLTGPYMHDGSLRSLREVVAFYNQGAGDDPAKNRMLAPLGLNEQEMLALVAFMESLTGSNVDELAADARSTTIGDRQSNGAGAPEGN